jgi:hypothetical protein
MRRLYAALGAVVLAATLACSGSGSLVGPADTAGQASLASKRLRGQEPISNNAITQTSRGQEPASNNALLLRNGQEPSSHN